MSEPVFPDLQSIDYTLLNHVIFFVGEITIIVLIGLFCLAVCLAGLAFYSIRKGRLIFPGFIIAGLVFVEGFSKALFSLFGLEDREIMTFFIRIHNTMNRKAFEKIPVSERAVFFPQCLRSSLCPAHLTPEGLECAGCGRCRLHESLQILEGLGYRTFIVPGSSFIKRMVKKYRPKAIIGIGCLSEVKEGLDMSDKIGLIGMGVVNEKEGCVETSVNWDDVFGVALIGIPDDTIPDEIKKSIGHHEIEHF